MRKKKVVELKHKYEAILREQNKDKDKDQRQPFDKAVFRKIKDYWKIHKEFPQ